MSPPIVAFVPMRHSSERVPGKNYRDFNGRPLFHHIVSSLLESGRVARVVIDTDSDRIIESASAYFPDVICLRRPPELLGGDVPMTSILRHDVSQVEGELFLQTHSTNPLLSPSTIGRAIDAFLNAGPEIDSLFTVTRLQTRLYWSDGRAINHDPAVLLRTQDLPPVYEENSNLYIFTRALAEQGRRMGDSPLMFEVDPVEALDIDEESDFIIAEAVGRYTCVSQ